MPLSKPEFSIGIDLLQVLAVMLLLVGLAIAEIIDLWCFLYGRLLCLSSGNDGNSEIKITGRNASRVGNNILRCSIMWNKSDFYSLSPIESEWLTFDNSLTLKMSSLTNKNFTVEVRQEFLPKKSMILSVIQKLIFQMKVFLFVKRFCVVIMFPAFLLAPSFRKAR